MGHDVLLRQPRLVAAGQLRGNGGHSRISRVARPTMNIALPINNNDINDNLIPDVTEIANTRLKELDILQKSKDRDQKNKEHQDKMSFERDKLKQERILKEKEIKAKLIDSQNKVKIAKTNKNKYDKSKKK